MKRCLYLLLAGIFLAPSIAYAEMIRGMIANIDPANNILVISRTDAAKNKPQQLNIKVKNDTKTKNVGSLKELAVGQEVKVDAKENKTEGVWEAKSVELTSPQSSSSAEPSTSASERATPGAY